MTKRDFPPIHPGEVLLTEFLQPLGISQYRLAKDIGVTPRRINEIVHGRRAVVWSAVACHRFPSTPREGQPNRRQRCVQFSLCVRVPSPAERRTSIVQPCG
jgi:hypothetical protein